MQLVAVIAHKWEKKDQVIADTGQEVGVERDRIQDCCFFFEQIALMECNFYIRAAWYVQLRFLERSEVPATQWKLFFQ